MTTKPNADPAHEALQILSRYYGQMPRDDYDRLDGLIRENKRATPTSDEAADALAAYEDAFQRSKPGEWFDTQTDAVIRRALQAIADTDLLRALLSGDLSALKAVCPEGYAVVPLTASDDLAARLFTSRGLKESQYARDWAKGLYAETIAAAQSEGGA